MRLGQKSTGMDTPTATTDDSVGINASNWLARAKAWPTRPKPVIRNQRASDNGQPTPAPWHAWMLWFHAHEISTKFAENHGVVIVPEVWPEDFDSTWYPSDKSWTWSVEPILPGARERVGIGLAALAASLGSPVARRGQPGFSAAAERAAALETIEKRKEHWRSPLTLGPALARRLGVEPAALPEDFDFSAGL